MNTMYTFKQCLILVILVSLFSISLAAQNNNAPIAVDDLSTGIIGRPVTGYLLNNDFDPDGDNLTTTLAINPINGTIIINPDGSFVYISNFTGTDFFQYSVCDDGNPILCDTATAFIHLIDSTDFITNVFTTNITDCGLTNGVINIQKHSVWSGLEYSIDNGITWVSNVSVFSNLDTGSYHVMVKEAGTNNIDTFANNPVVITSPIAPVINAIASTNPTNCGVNDGTITIAATGINLEYSINGGTNWQVSNTFTGLQTGIYNIHVRNSNGTCEIVYLNNPVILIAPNAPTITNVSSNAPTDCNITNGIITITATGGSGALEYSIDGGATWQASNIFTGLSGGTYQIRVRNIDGSCEVFYPNVTLIDKVPPVIINVVHTNITNCNVTDGTITITAIGNNNTLEYSIDGGTSWQVSNTFTGLSGGTYQIRVRNIDGTCQVSDADVVITAPIASVITNVATTNPSNCGVNDGTITVTAIGINLEYSIDGGINWQASNTFTGLGTGTYLVVIRNNNGTCLVNANNPITITPPIAPIITNVLTTNPTDCGITDGTIIINVAGGSGSYEYSIDGGVSWTNTTGSFTGLSALGNPYQIRVRNAADNSCQVSYSDVTLIDKVPPVITNVTYTDITNCTITNGTITITAIGNSLEYSIDGGATWSPSNSYTNLLQGTYQIRVRNIDGTCQVSSVDVTLAIQPFINLTHTDANCGANNGTATVNVTGGTPPYFYSWSTGQTAQTITGLSSGTYFVWVTDSNGCVDTASVVITNNNIPPTVNAGNDTTICIGSGNIMLNGFPSGGFWFGAGVTTAGIFDGTTAGIGVHTLSYSYTDINNCTSYDSMTVTVLPFVTFQGVNYLHSNDSLTISLVNNTGVEYSIDSGLTWQSSNIFHPITYGNYTIAAKYANMNCVGYDNLSLYPIAVNDTFSNNPLVSLNIQGNVTTNDIGNNTIAALTYLPANGYVSIFDTLGNFTFIPNPGFIGTDTIQYSICDSNFPTLCDTATVYLNVMDTLYWTSLDSLVGAPCNNGANGIITMTAFSNSPVQYSIDNGLTWQTNGTFTGLTQGHYYIAATNGIDTIRSTPGYVVVSTSTVPIITNVYSGNPTTCIANDGVILITTLLSSSYYEYSIDSGATWQLSNTYTGLSCGTYEVLVKSGFCETYYGQIILNQTLSFLSVTKEDVICGQNVGEISIVAQNGNGNYQYSIDSGLTWQALDTFFNISIGNYNVFINDGSDTVAYANNPVVVTQVGTPAFTTNYGGDFITINSTPNTNIEYSLDCGTTWQTSPTFQPVSGTMFCSAVRYTDGSCPLFSTDTFVNTLPIAINDSISFQRLNIETFNVLNNDTDAENNNLYVQNTPQTINIGSASITIDSLGNVTVPTTNFNFGTYSFDYIICEKYNPTHCDTATVQFTIVPPTQHVYDTIAIGATHTLCIPNNLGGTAVSLTNVCGTIPNIVIDSIVDECLYLYADNYGDATTCVVMCDNSGLCDTTYLHFNVQDGVWPGDTDDDTYVNNFDLLNIGLGYGTSGTTRDSITNVWNGYITPSWNLATPASNIDFRHLDCNGDGIINAADTIAILQNYGFSYDKNGGGSSFGTPLYVGTDTSYALPHFSLPIYLGDATNPAADIYGGAFSILYDTSLIKKDSVYITFGNNWIGTNNIDMISINKNFGNEQQIDAAFTRINGTNVTGFGEIGQLNFTIKDDILQRGFNVDSVIFNFYITNIKFISANEQEIDIAASNTSWTVTNTQSESILGKDIKIFPNPTREFVHIQSPNLPIENIIITDVIGRTVLQQTPSNNRNIQLNLSTLEMGVYYLQLETEKGIITKKLVVID